MSGESVAKPLKSAGNFVANPYTELSKNLGIGKNSDLLKALDLTSPLKQMEVSSDLLNFKEGQNVVGSVTGRSDKIREASQKANVLKAENMASDKANIEKIKQSGDLLSYDSSLLTPTTKTASGQAEFQRLLTLFQGRQAEISGSRARPGISQTRLV